MLKSLKCPSCGADYNPSNYQCDYCGSYIIMSDEKYVNFNNIDFKESDNEKYKGIYVFGTLLGKGERPINLGAANLLKGVKTPGGKLLLTNKTLSFSSHTFLQKKTNLIIDLKDIESVKVAANLVVSQHIVVKTTDNSYRFVVYHGQEWVDKIMEAKKNAPTETSSNKSSDYIEELQKLKKLLDDGTITQEEFDLKKRMLLNI